MNIVQKFLKDRGMIVLPDTNQWINRFEIRSETSDRVYTVAQRANKSEWCCSCPGWKRFRHCKHLDSIKPLLANIPKTETA